MSDRLPLPAPPPYTRRMVLLGTSGLALLLALAAAARPTVVESAASDEAWSDGTRFDDGRGFAD
jgi:hypothetical protein